MTGSDQQPKRKTHWLNRSLLVLIVLLVLLVAALLMPRYRSSIATVDDAHQWPDDVAPPRREIVWQPAIAMELTPSQSENESQIRPQVADQGTTLYFTRRSLTTNNVDGGLSEASLDIVRANRTVDGWSDPKPVVVLNSESDDVGPVISHDGQTLFFYSDRAGGLGGMDLYWSRRVGDSWSDPVNVGDQINSPADEYDPAIALDSQRLYFSSNRSRQMQLDLLSGKSDSVNRGWQTTLRSDPGSRTFDLYAADWNQETKLWNRASAMTWLNTSGADEGSAFVSPDGAFLYFASDRPTRSGEANNFDLYRWRIGRRDFGPENLGLGVNTAQNEIEPSLSESGFKLAFSRSNPQSSNLYSLYQSTAKEVYHDGQWKGSNFSIVSTIRNLFSRYWLLLALIAALVALIWLILQLRARDIAVPGFLLAALLIHFLMVTGSFFVFFQQQITEKMREVFYDEEVVATQFLSPEVATKAEPAFDDVAKLEMPQPIHPTSVARETFSPAANMKPIEMAQPQPIAQFDWAAVAWPQDQVIASIPTPAPVEPPRPQTPSPLRRSVAPSTVRSDPAVDQIQIEETIAAEIQPLPTPVNESPVLDRQEDRPMDTPIKVADVSIEPKELALTKDSESIELVDSTKIEIAPSPVPSELTRSPLQPKTTDSETTEPSVTEEIAAVEIQEMVNPQTQSVEMQRRQVTDVPAVAQADPLTMIAEHQQVALPPTSESLESIVDSNRPASAFAPSPTSSPLQRSRAPRESIERVATDSPAATETIKLAVEKTAPLETSKPNVELARTSKSNAAIKIAAVDIATNQAKSTPSVKQTESLDPIAIQLTSAETAKPNPQDSPLKGVMQRRRSARRTPLYADARVNMQNLLMRRKLDQETKLQVVEQFGGSDKTLEAIERGLVWIEQHQEADGHWGLNDFHNLCKDHKRCNGHGNSKSDTAGTALALLPFLGDGNTHRDGRYKDNVSRGIDWLLKHQRKDGNLFSGGEQNATMYSHAIATIALCECYSMTNDAALREPSQRAIDFIVSAQDPKSGGWRYRPRHDGDTSVVGWQVMALKSGQMANLNVPEKPFTLSRRWLDSVAGDGKKMGQFAYQRGRFNPAMTAEGLLCLQYMNDDRESEYLVHGSDFLLSNLPKKGKETSYYWYYATQTMFHYQGEHWKKWNETIHPLLISTQRKDGPMAGTWDPHDQWEKGGGRIYSTSLRVLMLEVYYRHLPLYQVIQ